MKRIVLLWAGVLALVLGAIGIFLPVMPTTPFVLLAGVCFSHSSPKSYEYLLKSPTFGPYLENYRTKQGVPLKLKIKSLVMLWGLLLLSAVLAGKLWVWLLLMAVGLGVTAHLLSIKTRRPEECRAPLQEQPPIVGDDSE